MIDLAETLELGALLRLHGIDAGSRNFESIYSDLHAVGKHTELLRQLNARLVKYFHALRLPKEPTVYDYLVLSLREKDVIATFNWDPLIFQACRRHYGKVPLPRVLYLHGNVKIGYCESHHLKGPNRGRCWKCDRPFSPSPLLLPVQDKDYSRDPFLRSEWAAFQHFLEEAYVLTIFGYGAPETDLKAMSVMKEAWRRHGQRDLEEIEIIDIRPHQDLRADWDSFITRSHYRTCTSFSASIAASWPRRSCEAIFNQFMMLEVSERYSAPQRVGLAELRAWHLALAKEEALIGVPTGFDVPMGRRS